MSRELTILLATAASIGFFHTLMGPDHYIPFVAMAHARKWSSMKTLCVTALCGLGHIASSVLLGIMGIALGIAVTKLEFIESFRGNLAAWALIAFGLMYFAWGMRKASRNKPHRHAHFHGDQDLHVHEHVHTQEHVHVHQTEGKAAITPWILFTIFVFGPCEPLIPILMYPAAKNSMLGLVLVTSVFGGVTIMTMIGAVFVSRLGVHFLPMARLERYSHALAGATIFLCGIAIQFLGL
ncbi:sulfite exporter TauE/SafE family protein [Syntrophorhabdus aromaticivorans]|uniref:sulfite exporter TauE/SafE family protein n=1 Tax=Syntrophorhabdus aromaticivorans TaxID=328301 RepID=UPI0004295197|nr:sulfite exporter TauE/SafE family protein [Syntrophorhabdus aromaticivorans]